MVSKSVGAGFFGVHFLPLIFSTALHPFTAEAGNRSQTSPCGSCGRQSSDGKGFSPTISVFAC